MRRYIDADKLALKWMLASPKQKETFRQIIDEEPTADAVAVVRCRDCKHNQDNGGDCNRTITHTSRDLVCEVNEYKYIGLEYCSYGERKEE